MQPKSLVLFDTSIATDNLGDEIIMDAVTREARALRPDDFFIRLPTHEVIDPLGRKYAQASRLGFVGGTNLLCANWFYRRQWQVGLRELGRIGTPVLMGVGWHFYQRKTDILTSWFLRRLLGGPYTHSVRDSYTLARLKTAGVERVVNTGCPTMWCLTPDHCAKIPRAKAKNAVITVTAYRSDILLDTKWIEQVLGAYERVYFWSQMQDDLEYFRRIAGDRFELIPPSLAAYDHALTTLDIDFIGTRLHGGIRAMQHGRRALILEVDNRAAEIARDTGLPTDTRGDVEKIAAWIQSSPELAIRMPWDAIADWKAQFGTSREFSV